MNKNILELGALVLAVIFFILIYFLKKKKVDFSVLTILAVGLGIIVGLIFKENYLYLEAIGTIYANLISAIVVPLLLFSIISSITNLQASIN